MTEPRSTPILAPLVALFYPQSDELGRFEEVKAADMPAVYQTLLAHQKHMTVTVEQFHKSPVDVRVIETFITGSHYSRKILLARQTDGVVVQFGIVRLNFAHVSPAVRSEIESQRTPVGRVLINHKVLREIHLVRLWKVTPGPALRELFGLNSAQPTYGRTALIDCNGEPAVELLEIVTPVSA